MCRLVVCLLCLCVVVGLLDPVSARSKRKPHRRCQNYNEYLNVETGKCQTCSTCGPGRGVATQCGAKSDTTCEECEAGKTFSTGRSHMGSPCYSCSKCGGREVLTECTPSSDTVCGECPIGTYWDEIFNKCRTCSFCFGHIRQASYYTVKACVREEIPPTHWCIQLSSPPHPAPLLKSTTNPDGSVSFYTDSNARILDLDTSQPGALEYEQFVVLDEISQQIEERNENPTSEVEKEGWLDHTVKEPSIRTAAPPTESVNSESQPSEAMFVEVIENEKDDETAPLAGVESDKNTPREAPYVVTTEARSPYDVTLLIACSVLLAISIFLAGLLAWKKCQEMKEVQSTVSYKPIYKGAGHSNFWTNRELKPYDV